MTDDNRAYASSPERAAMHAAADDLIAAAAESVRVAKSITSRRVERDPVIAACDELKAVTAEMAATTARVRASAAALRVGVARLDARRGAEGAPDAE